MHQNIYNHIISKDNLLIAWQEFKIGKKNKNDVQIFEYNLAENIISLHNDLKTKSYQHGYYSSFYIHDPKLRHIHKASVRDRVLHHAVMRIIEPIFETSFIFDSYSSRTGKGTHKAVLRLNEFGWKLSRNNTRTVWALKCDIKKFFGSIDHQVLFDLISKRINDKEALGLIKEIIQSYPKKCLDIQNRNSGIPLGNLTSQLFSNIYLNPFDQFIKRNLKARFYLRYADDFVVLNLNRECLVMLIPLIQNYLNYQLKLTLHPDKIVLRKWNQGIDYLGYVIFPYFILLRTKTKRRIFRKIKENSLLLKAGSIDLFSYNQSLQSYLGILKHCRGQTIDNEIHSLTSNVFF